SPFSAALHHPVKWISDSWDQGTHISSNAAVLVDHWCGRKIVSRRIEVKCLSLIIASRAIQAEPHPQVQCKSLSDVPIVLDVRFEDLVPQIVLRLGACLREAGDPSSQQIGECISRGHA